jgi:hypothetical protein
VVLVAHHLKAVHLQDLQAAEWAVHLQDLQAVAAVFSQCLIQPCKAEHLQVHHKAGHLLDLQAEHLQAGLSSLKHRWTQL